MSDLTLSPVAVVADTIMRTVELGVTITDAAVDGEVTVVFCDLLTDGRQHCPGCGGQGVYRDTVIRKVTDVPVVGHPLTSAGARTALPLHDDGVLGKCSPTTPPRWRGRVGRPRGGVPATFCAD